MAADSSDFTGHKKSGFLIRRCSPKIVRLDNGYIMGGSGAYEGILKFQWFLEKNAKTDWPDFDAEFAVLLLAPSGEMTIWTDRGGPEKVVEPFYCIGDLVCCAVMTGAMAMGAGAERAVSLAIKYADGASGSVQVESLHVA